MVGIGEFACEPGCCKDGGDPEPCETTCCEGSYPDAIGIWVKWNPGLDFAGMNCSSCAVSFEPFQIILEKDAEFAPAESPGDCSFLNVDGCFSPLEECASEMPCINASYRASLSTGCDCCINVDPELAPPTYCTRVDYYFWAAFISVSVLVDMVIDWAQCTVYLEVLGLIYKGPDCDSLELCSYGRHGYIAVAGPGNTACSCGLYDIVPYGSEGGGCDPGCGPDVFAVVCSLALFPGTEEDPEYGQIEVLCL
jgi:hypothetical protein